MRLERLTLSPYGRFADLTLEFKPVAALHVVLGRNESGKTTALAALGDLIYGFPGQTPYGFRHDQRLLRVGGVFRLADGSRLEFRRRKGNVNTLVDADDRPISDAALIAALGSVDRKTFESEFGLTSRALREGGAALLKAGGGLAETLAASSAGLSALAKLRERLSAEADELFTPRRSAGRKFYVALDAYEAAEKKLREATVTADALKAVKDRLLLVQAKENDLKAQHDEASRALAKLQRADRTHRKLARLSLLARELEAFVDLPEVDAASLDSWRAALKDDREIATRLAQLAADAEAEKGEIAALEVDEALIAEGPRIDALREKLGAARKAAEDLPRRIEARAQAIAQLDEIARKLGLADHSELLAAQPTDPEISGARAIIEARKRAEERRRDALADAERKFLERDRLLSVAAEPVRDPEPLSRRLAPLAESLADADRLRRERLSIEAEANSLREAAARLDPPVADLDAFARASLPDDEVLAHAARRETELAELLRTTLKQLAQAQREVETAERALASRQREGAGKTPADWIFAREKRDVALDRLGEALDSDYATRRQNYDDARALISAADAIGDAVVADTERAARLQAAREELSERHKVLRRAENERRRIEDERGAAGEEARQLWASAGIEPRGADHMARWGERAYALLQRRSDLARRRAEADALAQKLDFSHEALKHWLADIGRPAPGNFEFAYREARAELEAMNKAWLASREAAIARENSARAAKEAEAEIDREEAALAKILKDWPQAMRGLALPDSASLAEAEAALEAWRAVASPRQSMMRETRSVEGIEGDLAAFAAGVNQVLRAAAAELASQRAEEALPRLIEKLAAARKAAAERAQLQKSSAQRAAKQRGEVLRRETIANTLQAAAARLGAEDTAALALALERLEARRALEEERTKLKRDIVEIGDGLDEAALCEEQAGLDLALLLGEIELTKRRLSELLQEIPEAARAARDAQAEHDALAEGRDAAGAARERMEARGELLDIAERWLIRQGAARLAARAIERRRAEMEDPLIRRAGELLRIATAESFVKLATDYDDADRPVLVAVRDDGERVRIEGFSEGARDQLFLALRLALIERRAGEPLPFIGDDILASFDDERTKRTLALLADFARKKQAIVFTHHRHVAELAAAAGADVIGL